MGCVNGLRYTALVADTAAVPAIIDSSTSFGRILSRPASKVNRWYLFRHYRDRSVSQAE